MGVHRKVKYKTYHLFDDHWVLLLTWKVFYYFYSRRNEIIWALDPSKFVNRRGGRFPLLHVLETTQNFDKKDMKDVLNVWWSLWYLKQCHTVGWESWSITTQPGDCNMKSKEIAFAVLILAWISLSITLINLRNEFLFYINLLYAGVTTNNDPRRIMTGGHYST